jgi:predicted nucleotidyltransferase
MMLSVPRERPVDALTIDILRRVDAVARELRLPFFIVGALARDILLTHVFGIETTRATRDVDLAIAVESWERFHAIKDRLGATGQFTIDRHRMQRLYHTQGTADPPYPLDLIPFGGVQQDGYNIAWPPDMAVVMNVIAYEEALSSAITVAIAENLTIAIASLPSLALLKLFAWVDRHNETPKDAQDLVILCRGYERAGNEDRLYGPEIQVLETVDYDLELASARLLGNDARLIASASTLNQARIVCEDEKLVDRLVSHMAIELKAVDDSIAHAEKLLKQFKTGLLQA